MSASASELSRPAVVDRATFNQAIGSVRQHEKAHTHAGDALAAERRRLPMVAVNGSTPLRGPQGALTLLDAFEGRQSLIAYYFMWYKGKPAPEQCEGCTFFTTQIRELSHFHSRNVTYATFCQGPLRESLRYRDFMGWEMPWYSAMDSLDKLLGDRIHNRMHIICYLRNGTDVFETYWTTSRGAEYLDNTYRLLDLTVYGRQEEWEDSPDGWPRLGGKGKARMRIDGRPISQWPRLRAGFSDDLQSD